MFVKCALFLSDGNIITGSRDKTAILWNKNESSNYNVSTILEGHSNFVNSIIEIEKTDIFPNGAIITGSTDSLILVWDKSNLLEPHYTLIGHNNTVCSVACSPNNNNIIISASYDGTAIVWDLTTGKQKCVLDAHDPSVLCASILKNGQYVTGGADKLIKLWNEDGTFVREFSGHTDGVRKIIQVDDIGFCSCANDGTTRVWAISGECLQQYVGHQDYVYGIASINGIYEFATCGEDKFVNIWKDGASNQSIIHPGSVWSVEHRKSENGFDELITGCSDGIARIWTKDAAFAVSEEEMKTYFDNIQILVNENEKNTSQSQVIDGVKYDYVWHVDLGDGVPMLYLGYNNGDDPMDAAKNFVYKNNLAVEHIQTIVEFIKTNTQQFEITQAPKEDEIMYEIKQKENLLFPVFCTIGYTSISSLNQIKKKIIQVNSEMNDNSNTKLNDNELLILNSLIDILQNAQMYHSSVIHSDDILILLSKLSLWSCELKFVCNDLVRVIMAHPKGGITLLKVNIDNSNIVEMIMNSGITSNCNVKNFFTSSQALCNFFSVRKNIFWDIINNNATSILSSLSNIINNSSEEILKLKVAPTAFITLLLNFSVVFTNKNSKESDILECFNLLSTFLLSNKINKSDEAIFRGLVGLGTILVNNSNFKNNISSSLKEFITNQSENSKDERIKKASSMLVELF